MNCPHIHLVPRELEANLRFRRSIIEQGNADPEFAAQIWQMASEDILFFINVFSFTYDPRKLDCPIVPFITYPYQDEAILRLFTAMGRDDVLVEKSRDMGASWICVTVILWFWLFRTMQSFLLLSRIEDLVDKTEDPKSLYFKIDMQMKYMPGFMLPRINRQKLHLLNLDNGSTIDGASTTGEAATGDRRTAIMLDEFAKVPDGHAMLSSTRDATRCRIFNSTPKGSHNAFYDQRKKMLETNGCVIRLHWSLHPEKNIGLYFVKGKAHSPWYDNECKRAAHPMEIAQELDIDYLNSDFQFFSAGMVERIKKQDGCDPFARGEVDLDEDGREVIGFAREDKGRLKLWLNLHRGRPRNDREYVFGIDVSQGTGASNSCISIGDAVTGEKVGEWTSPNVRPEQFAKIAVALANWFSGPSGRGAFMIWEANGPGRGFGATVIELGYRNVFFREKDGLNPKTSDVPGWFPTDDGKTAMLGDYRRALEERSYVNHSVEAVSECLEYIFMIGTGRVAHARSAYNIDPSGAKSNHGDRVIADALCWKGLKRFDVKMPENLPPPRGSLAERRAEHEREKRLAKTVW